MAAGMAPFQIPGNLAGTLAAYESLKRSAGKSPQSQHISVEHEDDSSQNESAIYKRALPSLHFLRWRPMYHLQAPNGWMNDPCAPGYDPSTGLYHLSFQWNPRRNVYGSIVWGSIAWGHATSKDLTHWTVSGMTSIKPGAWYDREGCFTGCMLPPAMDGSKNLTVFYTGVSRLPLHYTLPYTNQTETLNIAQSTDGGTTWRKYKSNPIHPEPPVGMPVSGWRDPYVMPWPTMDAVLGKAGENNLYGTISGGLKDHTPTIFLYAINRNNLAEWVFISALIELGLNHNISRWSGDMGINWECANFMTLGNQDTGSREFIVVGGEGTHMEHPNSTFTQYPHESTKFPRTERSLQWMSGTLNTVKSIDGQPVPRMKYTTGGRFDHGCLYGVNSFFDPITSKQIAFGWITEEDLPQKLVDRQNWSGMLSLPRELCLLCLRNVRCALISPLESITSLEVEPQANQTYTIRTLRISPAAHIERLRQGTRELEILRPQTLNEDGDTSLDIQTCRFELTTTLAISDTTTRIGLTIFHSQDYDIGQATSIHFTPSTESLTIERPDSSQIDPNISTFPETAPFTLFTFATSDGDEERENLNLRIWFDESVLEVFANDRCTFATRVYPATKRCWGVKFWAEDEAKESWLRYAKAWDGLRADARVVG